MKMKIFNWRNQIRDMSFSTILYCFTNSRSKRKRMSLTKKGIKNIHFNQNFISPRPALLNFLFKNKLLLKIKILLLNKILWTMKISKKFSIKKRRKVELNKYLINFRRKMQKNMRMLVKKSWSRNKKMTIYKFLTQFKILFCKENLKRKEKQKKLIEI